MSKGNSPDDDFIAPFIQNEDKAREHLERVRWAGMPFWPLCGWFDVTRLDGIKHRKGVFQCNEKECRNQFAVTVGIVFERSKIPLHKWLLAIHMLCASKKSMSAHQPHRMINVPTRPHGSWLTASVKR